jgi:long-chain acyl-CoA synthetase
MEKTIPRILREIARSNPDTAAQLYKGADGSFVPVSYRLLYDQVITLASGLADLGLRREDRVGLISDNRREWMLADRAILSLGAADVPRGCDTTDREIAYILSFSECRMTFAENRRQLDKMIASRPALPLLETVILFDEPGDSDRRAAADSGLRLLSMEEVNERGRRFRSEKPHYAEREMDMGVPSEVATIIFTSGTTGDPKGVMLSHDSFVYQMESIPSAVSLKPGQTWLSVLPIWHSFNRILEYVAMSAADTVAYSKPIASVMLPDLAAAKPEWLGSVPRIWDALMEGIYKTMRQSGGAKEKLFHFFVGVGKAYCACRRRFLGFAPCFGPNLRPLEVLGFFLPLLALTPLYALGDLLVFRKIRAKLGGKFIAGVSGGGALPHRVDLFFQAIGVLLLEGYGLTESGPVVAVRRQPHPVSGTVGPNLPGTEIRIVGEGGEILGHGKQGVVHVRGRQVMLGYLKKRDLSDAAVSREGWLDTGDLGMLTRFGELKITGRQKDTIVLLGGENVEPAPIEFKLCESPYILQACVVGQDQKYLGALVVPKEEALMAFAKSNDIPAIDFENLLGQPEVLELMTEEIAALVSPKNGFKIFERVVRFRLLPKPFEAGKELSHKLDLSRHKVADIHRKAIAELYE